MRKSVMYSPASLCNVIRGTSSRTESEYEKKIKLFVLAVKIIRHGFNAEKTEGPQTICRNAKISTKAKPRFFPAIRITLLEVLVWKKSQTQSATATRHRITSKEKVLQAAKRKFLKFLRGAEDIPIPATAPNWNTALS